MRRSRRRKTPHPSVTHAPLLKTITLLKHLLSAAILVSLIGYFTGRVMIRELPSQSLLVPDLSREPEQLMTDAQPFQFTYRGAEYIVEPMASYDISGLVVSHNDIHAWWDIYHDENSVDIKDICVIWGENADEDIYKNITFWNESVSCHAKFSSLPNGKRFFGPALSNNHLITDDSIIQDKIREVRVGDQIRMKGYLVNYHDARYPEFVRKSSLTRLDTAGFACEVMYISQFDFLKKAPRGWHNFYEWSREWLVKFLILKLISCIVFPWIEFKLT